MHQRLAFASLLLMTSTLVAPAALAQASSPAQSTPPAAPTSTTGTSPDTGQPQAEAAAQEEEQVEVSTPGADADVEEIVVVGRNIPNVVRATPQVITVLSASDIARTGEGDIAGALTRVTGLSVVGGGFVYVRGLGDRYSSSLLNGSPLPSPEPLRRSVPLDIFPTTIVGSALVQKTYSANYPGEFGGGVINLTTKAIPDKNFWSAGLTVSADTVTTSELGYTYDGGDWDWTGFDDGTRDTPRFIKDAPTGTGVIPVAQTAQLTNAKTTLLQRNNQLPANFSGEISGGSVLELGSDKLGVISSISLSNTWRTRVTRQQDTVSEDGTPRNDFNTLITDNRIVANALIGIGYEFDENVIRWTNVYIHDTLKQGRGSVATGYINAEQITDPATGTLINAPRFQQNTNWFERALLETQLVGEFRVTDAFEIDVRGAYANSKRKSPYERQFDYICQQQFQTPTGTAQASVTEQNGTEGVQCPGAYAVTGRFPPTVSFSDLDEDLYNGQVDLSYKLPTDRPLTLSTGYYYSKNDRTSSRLDFRYQLTTGSGVPGFPYNLYRPDFLLSPDVLNNATPLQGTGSSQVNLLFSTVAGAYAYDAKLEIHAGYVQAEAEAFDGLRATAGIRYEDAKEEVTPINSATTRLANSYFLPAGTITWNFAPDMQLRVAGSKTLSRPQFRELAPQQFRDPDSDRLFFGNLNLQDSELYNLEARYEWFFARDQRVTLAGFYKLIENPIEQVGFYTGSDDRLQTGFTNLPEATLYGAEFEVQKYFPLYFLGDAFATRRLLTIANYTYTKSEITADQTCVPNPASAQGAPGVGGCPSQFGPANLLFRDGAALTGQSDHLVNLQIGIEDTERLSQITLLFNYASERVTNRGPSNLSGVGFQPDIIEKPGVRLDLVARQGIDLLGGRVEVKAEARNLTGTRYQERQTFDNGNVISINSYRQGRIFSLGASVAF
jgi:TonB-dependent receptor